MTSPFATWTWASAWWRHLGAGELHLYACEDVLVPLVVTRERGLRVARWLGHGPGDQLGPIHSSGRFDAAAAAARRVLDRGDWDLFVGEGMPGDEGWASALGAIVLDRDSSPVLDVPNGGWDAWLAGRSRNLREQVRRRERALARDFELTFRLADEHSWRSDLERLFELHEARWGETTTTFVGARRDFHVEVAAGAAGGGWLRLWTLELDGRAVAAWYGFRVDGREWFYNSGRDPTFEERSVGFVLLCHTIRAAMADGVREYRLLLGDEPYKQRFMSNDPGLETVARAASLRGRAAVALMRARRR